MTRRHRLLIAALFLAAQPAGSAQEWKLVQTVDSGLTKPTLRTLDLGGASGYELFFAGEDGGTAVWSWDAKAGRLAAVAGKTPQLARPERALLQFADVLGTDGPPQLVVLSPEGAQLFAPTESGGLAPDPLRLASRARFQIRTGRPTFTRIAGDVNADGRLDLILPTQRACELWLQSAPKEEETEAAKAPRFRRAARLGVRVEDFRITFSEDLSDVMESSFSIPSLQTEDVNADSLPDLLVTEPGRRAFHLQREDGSYPVEPDVAVDLSIFRDTSPAGGLVPGEILAGNQEAQFRSRDLDLDGLPDYVIAHRRKVWIFHGREEGPQFQEPTSILKVADDVTALTLMPLDTDEYPDLLLIKLAVPTKAAMLLGLVRNWTVSLRAVGYASEKGRSFAVDPKWKRDLELELPPLLDVIQNPHQWINKLENLEQEFLSPTTEDFDGDGLRDRAMISRDGLRIEHWLSRSGEGEREWNLDPDARLRGVLFERETTRWTLEEVLDSIAAISANRLSTLTADRDPDGSSVLRNVEEALLLAVDAADLDGDGSAELLISYQDYERPDAVLVDVLTLR